jgi:hypothetical protein
VTDNKSPGDRLLELMVFGPTGLAVTLVEEFPKFVEKGRHRVEGQVHTARLVGQFAFQMGRRQLEQSLGHLGGNPDANGPVHPTSHAGVPEEVVSVGRARAEDVPPVVKASGITMSDSRPSVNAPGATPTPTPSGEGEGEGEAPLTPWRPSVWLGSGGPNGTGSPSSLAIPGYDSLSASQVVQRLEGLSSPELEEVRAHEAAHRQRRTILHRVEQLLTGGDGPTP